MYATLDEARAALDESFSAEAVDTLLAALTPAIVFVPVEGDARPGATRIGGDPDLPPDVEWPVRPSPPNIDEIVSRGGSAHGAHIREHLAQALPYQFAAQIDLAEAAQLGDVAAPLPAEGRLLFFFDMAVAPWRNGPESCRVIWDRSPVEKLARAARPEALARIGAKSQREWRDICAEHGWPEPPPDKCSYWGPSRPMRLAAFFALPDRTSIDAQRNAALQEALTDEDFEEDYSAHFDERWFSTHEMAHRQQMLGAPHCEQDDPRYDAVAVQMKGGAFLSREEWKAAWPAIEAGAADWLLLFQLDQSNYLQETLIEGTVYFLIRRNDLAARAFDKVVAIYQQT